MPIQKTASETDGRREFLSRTGQIVGGTLVAAMATNAFAQSKNGGKLIGDVASEEEKKLLTARAAKASKADVLSLLTSKPTNAGLDLQYRDLRSIRAAFDKQFSDMAGGIHPADNCCCCCPCCCCSAAAVTNPIRGI